MRAKIETLVCKVHFVISWVTPTTAFLMWQLTVASRLKRTEYQLLLMKVSWWDQNVKIRYKCLFVIDEFLTVSLYQPNEFISWHWDLYFQEISRIKQRHSIYTVSQKTSHLWLAITSTHMNGFWYFFGRNVTDKIGNQEMLYNATSNKLCFCTSWQNAETRKSHISLNWIVTQNAPVRYLPERKNCHLWCVW